MVFYLCFCTLNSLIFFISFVWPQRAAEFFRFSEAMRGSQASNNMGGILRGFSKSRKTLEHKKNWRVA